MPLDHASSVLRPIRNKIRRLYQSAFTCVVKQMFAVNKNGFIT